MQPAHEHDPMPTKVPPSQLRVTFVLPFINHRGGIDFILQIAHQLTRLGDQVTAVWPTRLRPLPGPLNEIEYLWRAPWKALTCRWYNTSAKVFAVPSLKERYIPDGDLVVATAWQTAPWVMGYGPSKGRKAYYIQEPEIHRDPEACAATYRMPFDLRVTISDWTRLQLLEKFGQRLDLVTPEGIDHSRFPDRSTPPAPVVSRVGMVYDPSPKKGFDDGYQAFLAARERHPQLELHLLGVPRRPPRLPRFVVSHFHVAHQEKIRLFHMTDVWVSPSREEGWGLVPMEAMACGNAVLTTHVGGTPYFAIHGETALVVEPGDRAGLERGLLALIEDHALRLRLIREGSVRVRKVRIEDTALAFREAVVKLLQSR